METNTKRLVLLVWFINIALILIALSIIVSFIYAAPYAGKFSNLADRLPESEKFDGIRVWMRLITYLAVFKVVVFRVFFGVVLFNIRKIVKQILDGEVFNLRQANRIRKIAIYFLCFAALLLCFNFIMIIVAYGKGNGTLFRNSILTVVGVFESYILTGLIAFGIAEVFISGIKLQQEIDLTI